MGRQVGVAAARHSALAAAAGTVARPKYGQSADLTLYN
jgi:hypothetical protein